MKKVLVAAVGLVALAAAPALAADLPARPWGKAPAPVIDPVYDWTGLYIGGNGGYGSSRKCWDLAPGGVFASPDGCGVSSGGVAGGQFGYRWQSGTIVFGLEAQGDWAGLSGSHVGLTTGFTDRTRINGFGLFTGQIGLAWNNALLYVKGGGAFVSTKYDIFAAPGGALLASSSDTTRWGGTAGVGGEYGFMPSWSFALEYNHIFTDARLANFTTPGGAVFAPAPTYRTSGDTDVITARVNYRWGGPVVARY